MSLEQMVASHYTRGGLERAILDPIAARGEDIEKLTPADFSGADEFHLGWHAATVELGKALSLSEKDHVLDVGSGIGGPARYFAAAHGCHVTGIDLTHEFVEVANSLSRRCGLADSTVFQQANALAMPFRDASFDAATLIHVGMNISDKARLFSEAQRVLKPGGRFCVYDIMRVGDAEIPYPMPWAGSAATSFLEPPETYRDLLAAAGFRIETEANRREFVLALAAQMREKAASQAVPTLALNVTSTPERLANVMKTLTAGTIAPVEMIARAA